jgi:EAL domain-containing protein (putative c-di-GMP-specific phosphodiesterase class I)
VTEEALDRDMADGAGTFRTLRTMGVRIAVRDFGTGSSVLSYLREHDLDILKLDESFVGIIGGTDQTPPLVRGILELGNTLELEIVAAGLTLPAQIGELRAQRCDLAQGVLFAGPLSPTDAELLLAGGRDGAEPSGGVAVAAPVG